MSKALDRLTDLRKEHLAQISKHRQTRRERFDRVDRLEASGEYERAEALDWEIRSLEEQISAHDRIAAELEHFVYRLAADAGGSAPLQQQPTHTQRSEAASRLPSGAVLKESKSWTALDERILVAMAEIPARRWVWQDFQPALGLRWSQEQLQSSLRRLSRRHCHRHGSGGYVITEHGLATARMIIETSSR